ncbi:MAG: hypothetical protein LT071_05720 [Nocardioides sp.]|nr:hypothetical protein [Nocardioides sp.]
MRSGRRTTSLIALGVIAAGLGLAVPGVPASGATPTEWGAAEVVSDPAVASTTPRVVLLDGDQAVATWRQGPDPEVVSAVRAAGGAWSTPTRVPGSSGVDGHTLVRDSAGRAVAVWEARTPVGEVVRTSTRAQGHWSELPGTLSATWPEIRGIRAVATSAGELLVVWTAWTSTSQSKIQAMTRTPEGAWVGPVDLSQAGKVATRPSLAVDGAGTATVAWMCSSCDTIESVTRPSAGTWSSPVTLSQVGLDVFDPWVSADPGGAVAVSWTAMIQTVPERYAVQLARRPAGSGWAAPIGLTGPELVDGVHVVMLRGNPHVLWTQLIDGVAHLRWRHAEGDTWQPAQSLATESVADAYALATGNGELHVAWRYGTPGEWRLAARTLTEKGWTTTPVELARDVRTLGWAAGSSASLALVWERQSQQQTRGLIHARLRHAVPAPRITRLRLSRHRIEITSPRRRLTRTRVTIGLSTKARVRFVLVRRGSTRPAARFAKSLPAGRSRFRLTARVGGVRLRAGTYRLRARAITPAGRSAVVSVRLRVVR